MKKARMVLLFLLPSPSLLNILSSPPLVSLSSIPFPPSPSLPSLADIRDDLLSLLEQHSAGPQTATSAIRPEGAVSSQTQPKLTSPVIQSGGWKPIQTTPSPPPLKKTRVKPSSLPLNLPAASTSSLLNQEKTSLASSSGQSDQPKSSSSSQSDHHPNSLPFSRLQQLSDAEAIASKKGKGSEKAEDELDNNVDSVEKELKVEKAGVKQLDVLFREDIVNAGRPLSHA